MQTNTVKAFRCWQLTLNDWSRGEQWILFPKNLNVSRDEVEGNSEIRGKQNSLLPKGPVIKCLLYSETKQKQNLKTALRFHPSRATAVNISRVTVNCFPFHIIVLAMLPAHGIWRETVSLLDVMWPWTNEWARSSGKNAGYITISFRVGLSSWISRVSFILQWVSDRPFANISKWLSCDLLTWRGQR